MSTKVTYVGAAVCSLPQDEASIEPAEILGARVAFGAMIVKFAPAPNSTGLRGIFEVILKHRLMADDFQRIELISGGAQRRHWLTEQKLQIIEESFLLREMVSSLATYVQAYLPRQVMTSLG